MELAWDVGEKVIRFVAHVVPGNSGLLLGRSDLKALASDLVGRRECPFCGNTRRGTDPCVLSRAQQTVGYWTLSWKLPPETLCVCHTDRQLAELQQESGGSEIHSRGTHRSG